MRNRKRNIYSRAGSLNPSKSMFDLSYSKLFDCDMGQLIPVMCDEVVPGDFFKIGNQAVVRFQPMVAPILHEINVYCHYFFVPYRLLWDDWETFITGGISGEETPAIPTWSPTSRGRYSLWDYLGFPEDVVPTGAYPLTFPRDAYNLLWNEYYRDETLQVEVLLTNESMLQRNWEKDYFTSALPWQQRGTGPALPVAGTASAVWDDALFGQNGSPDNVSLYVGTSNQLGTQGQRDTELLNLFNDNTVDLSTASTFDIADLRLAFQIQKWMERNARCGARYTEFLQAHFSVSPRDERLQRPEYIGGTKSPIIVSEVLQTSSTDTESPQGNMAGHAISVNEGYAGKYHVKEYGLIMGIMSVMPRSVYASQGVQRQWLKRTKFDFFFPEFVNLSEQAIENAEICAVHNNTTHNQGLFGYQGRYDELRQKNNMICGAMRSTFDYWHLARIFNPASPPALNTDFITCNPDKRIFAVENVPGLIVHFSNLIKAFRPLPLSAEPGLIDHH
nr:MAG: major capsid protein [Microvirus sp.]